MIHFAQCLQQCKINVGIIDNISYEIPQIMYL